MSVSNHNSVGQSSFGDFTIRLKEVTKRFGSFEAVAKLDLEIYDKEMLVLLGPSGCGKSTTLNILAGLETPTRGSVYFGPIEVTHLPPEERDISMVFQSLALYPHLNVRENILFPLKIRREKPAIIVSRLAEIVELLGIGTFLERYTHERRRWCAAQDYSYSMSRFPILMLSCAGNCVRNWYGFTVRWLPRWCL